MQRCSGGWCRPNGQHYLVSEPQRGFFPQPNRPGMYSRVLHDFLDDSGSSKSVTTNIMCSTSANHGIKEPMAIAEEKPLLLFS